ncbi:MAG: NPCBM/NEW2 domain-containing protein [Planctomycetes bacterium]|nr:NPCBM/NEW2 domain-containing protein [Planctomycetota bacterium]
MTPPRTIAPAALAAALAAALLAALVATPSRAAAAPDAPSRAAPVRVDRISAEPMTARRVVSLDRTALVLEIGAGGAANGAAPGSANGAASGSADDASTTVSVPLADVVEILLPTPLDPTRAWAPNEVAADLWSGETVIGELKGGDGEHLDIDAPLLGRVRLPLERLATVRFLQRLAQSAEPPDLRPRKDADVIHLVGDQFSGTIEGFGEKSLKSVTQQKDKVEIPYERVVAVSLVSDERAASAPAAGFRVALRDGTRVTGLEAKIDAGRLAMTSPSGFKVDCAVADVVAIQSVSPQFAFLSDIPAATTIVKPVWEVAAGDPAVLFAPRLDQSFSGKPLRCGGRTWLDGIGAFSGTTMTWNLDGRYREFRTSAGLDDGAGPLGGVVFQVLVDGKEVWTSGFVRPASTDGRGAASPVSTPRIPLDGAKTLALVVLAGDAEDPYPVQDEADWLGAILVRAAGK